MSLALGLRLGVYEVVAPLGAGGMGEVYRARDTRLHRQVAIKVLPGDVAGDAARLARFEREAQALAALNHPNIAQIYGLEESGAASPAILAIVMELVEGPTLADRIARGPIPLSEALRIATQIADALEAAHDQGVIHRDLKPANIKVRDDGTVKVLDFGLAKIREDHDSRALADSPTMIATTTPGMILGTAAYMSPEQAKGLAADRSSDVWAFGCVVYEMLTGQVAFQGDSVADVLGEVLKSDPDWRRLPPGTPQNIRRLLHRALQKSRRQRLRDIADARLEIEAIDVSDGIRLSAGVAAPPARTGMARWIAGLALATATAGALGAMGAWTLGRRPTGPEARLEINTLPGSDPSLAVSPDGLNIVFVARSGGQPQLWLRSLDSPSARPLAGTERGSSPFWSPDSRSIAFFADARLKRVDVDGGSVRTLAINAAVPLGGSWNSAGTIIFADNPGGPILRIDADGGESVAATRLDSPQQRGHFHPQFLPDGRHFLFFVSASTEARGLYLGQLGTLEATRLLALDGPAVYAASGHLLFVREGRLVAQPFDANRLEVSGDPFPVADHVSPGTRVSTSAAGPLAYRVPSAESGQRQFVWIDRSGREVDEVVYPDSAAQGPSLSPDGRKLAVYRFVSGNMDIWVYEPRRRAWDRVTVDPGDDVYPLWSPDDSSMVFASIRKDDAVLNLYRKLLHSSSADEELLLATPHGKFPMDWSRDGRFLLYDSLDPKRGSNIWAMPLDGDRKPFEVLGTDFSEGLAQFSPDGAWIAYQSDKTSRTEVYLRPFPGPGSDVLISNGGGEQPRWNPRGKELFYIAGDDQLMAVPIRFSADGKSVEAGSPLALFATNVGTTAALRYRQQYVVSADGESFVMNSAVGDTSASPISVILNWNPAR